MEALELHGSCRERGGVSMVGEGDELHCAVEERLLKVHLQVWNFSSEHKYPAQDYSTGYVAQASDCERFLDAFCS